MRRCIFLSTYELLCLFVHSCCTLKWRVNILRLYYASNALLLSICLIVSILFVLMTVLTVYLFCLFRDIHSIVSNKSLLDFAPFHLLTAYSSNVPYSSAQVHAFPGSIWEMISVACSTETLTTRGATVPRYLFQRTKPGQKGSKPCEIRSIIAK